MNVQAAVAKVIHDGKWGDPGDDAVSDALDTIATRMAANFDVCDLLDDLHDGGYTVSALRRLIAGKAPHPGDESSLRKLLDRVEAIDAAVQRELSP